MLGTKKFMLLPGAQYIVKIFFCQPFVKNFAKKGSGYLTGDRPSVVPPEADPLSVAAETTELSTARRDDERDEDQRSEDRRQTTENRRQHGDNFEF